MSLKEEDWLGLGVEGGFGLEGGAERGERGEWGEIEQHIGSRNPLIPDFGDLYRFGVEMFSILHTILLWMCFFCVYFFNRVYINPTPLSLLLFLHSSDCNIGRDVYAKR